MPPKDILKIWCTLLEKHPRILWRPFLEVHPRIFLMLGMLFLECQPPISGGQVGSILGASLERSREWGGGFLRTTLEIRKDC